MKNKKLLKILLISLAVVTAGVIFTFVKGSGTEAQESVIEGSSDEDYEVSSDEETQSDDEAEGLSDEAEETSDDSEVCVHVCGAVNNSGVYYLKAGSRIHEAVEMAGGLTDDAAEEYVNLAQVITDGEQIYIPTYEEAEEEGLEIGTSASSDSSSESSDGLININTATSEELQTLPGIGETKAAAIITYRENNGDFSSVEDITNVSGIGDSTYENIKDYITV